MTKVIQEYLEESDNSYENYLHTSLGACRYYQFRKNQVVEISPEGYNQNIHELNQDCFGVVESFENGILNVRVFGRSKTMPYHPCYWIPTTKESHNAWEQERKQIDMEFTC